jgi:glucose/arabinose dehydrogenase
MAVELPPGFVAETLATNLDAATAIASAPDGRIFVAEQTGRLLAWKDGRLLDKPVIELPVADYWERGLIGLALAPDFPRPAHMYVLSVKETPFVHHVLSRFTVSRDSIIPETERVLFEGDDQANLGGSQPAGHQGGPLCFGADGKLYVALGEQTAGAPSQKLDTLQGKILRLNPDGSIPEDNPFSTKAEGKYRAIYALGVRNSFGLAAQPGTSRMFFTDVGGSAFEEVNELLAGANYGWPLAEGLSTNSAFKQPIYSYPPALGRSIVGAAFYPGGKPGALPAKAWPEKWAGRFFFGDFMNHWIKALDPRSPTNVITFARGLNGPVALEFASDGSLLVLNRGTIWRDPKKFVPNSGSLIRIRYAGEPIASKAATSDSGNTNRAALGLPMDFARLPKSLFQTGVAAYFTNRTSLRGVFIYRLNVEEWTPGVIVERALALPAGGFVTFSEAGEWRVPPGTVFLRQCRLLPVSPFVSTTRDLETRILVVGADYSYGASYRWTDNQSDAVLVEDGESIEATAPWSLPKHSHYFLPAPEAWLRSPETSLHYAPHLNTRQAVRLQPDDLFSRLRRDRLIEGVPADQKLAGLQRLAPWNDTHASAERRVRSYLDVHCAACHQPGGASRGPFDARIQTPLDQAGLIDGPLAAGDLGIAGAKIVVPGSPDKSILYQRLKRTDFFRMPPVAYHDEPSPILPVMAEWIRSLAAPHSAIQPFGQAAAKPASPDGPTAPAEGTIPPTRLSFRHHFIARDLPVRNKTTGDYGLTALVDLDRDGDLDFVLGGRGERPARLYWFEYQSPDRWVQHLVGTNYLSDVGLAAHDVDGDGWIDLIASGVWYRNPTRPKEQEFVSSSFAQQIAGAHDIVMADLDGDGRRDVVLMGDGRTELNSIRWYGIPADPGQPWKEQRIGEAVHGAFAPAGIGDLDGDGDNDVVRADTWFENADGKGARWLPHKNLPMGRVGPFGMCTRTVVVDIDGDGAQDLVVADADIAGSKVAILRNADRKGGEWSRTDLPQSFNYGSLHALAVADFDGDGDADIVVHEQEELLPAGRQNPRVVIWENLGQVRFTERIILDTRLGGHELQIGDVDRDGDIDICTKPWGPQPWNSNEGRMHVDYLENLTGNR